MSINLPFNHINEFSLHEIIQEGPYTLILRGYQKNLRRNVLVKLLKPHSSKELKGRFDREARVYAKLNHPNIVSVYALGAIQDYMYIILEYIDGCSLKRLLEKKSIPLDVLWQTGHSILDALKHAAEKKVVHRDIKPSNIMIDREGHVKVADFGLALISDEPHVTQQQALIGTPAYMSPEQITGDNIDFRSDIFSFGSMLYEMIYREQAFAGDSYSISINSILNDTPAGLLAKDDLNNELKKFLEKCLHKNKNERWPSIEAAAAAWNDLKKFMKSVPSGQTLKSLIYEIPVAGISAGSESKIFTKENIFLKKWYYSLAAIIILVLVLINDKQDSQADKTAAPLVIRDSTADSIKTARDQAKQRQSEIMIEKIPVTKTKENSRQQDNALSPGSINSAVQEKPAILFFNINPWAKIYLNDSLIDSHLVKKSINLPPALYSVRIEHPRFPPERRSIDLKSDEIKNIEWSFWEKTGFLDVQVRPWADVYINNEYYDTTPFKKPLQLPAGTQVLELKHPALNSYRELITIIQHDTLIIKKNLNSTNGIIFE